MKRYVIAFIVLAALIVWFIHYDLTTPPQTQEQYK